MVKQRPGLGEWMFVATPNRVPWLRKRVSDALAGLAVDRDAVSLAVTEAITNVIRHAYPAERPGRALVQVALQREQVVLSVQDFGIGREGFRSSATAGMGQGLRIIRSLAAEVVIEAQAGGTLVVMGFPLLVEDVLGG